LPQTPESRAALRRLPPLIETRQQKETEEMMGKLKELGNSVLGTVVFLLSDDCFSLLTKGLNVKLFRQVWALDRQFQVCEERRRRRLQDGLCSIKPGGQTKTEGGGTETGPHSRLFLCRCYIFVTVIIQVIESSLDITSAGSLGVEEDRADIYHITLHQDQLPKG
jgi:hypothetical protein